MEVPVYVMLSLGAVGVRSRARIPLPSRPLAGAAWARMLFSTSALPLPPPSISNSYLCRAHAKPKKGCPVTRSVCEERSEFGA